VQRARSLFFFLFCSFALVLRPLSLSVCVCVIPTSSHLLTLSLSLPSPPPCYSGRPARKLFRLSYVEGSIYLTWSGKFGNQGVDLAEVTSVAAGITTDTIRRTATPAREMHYLSLVCPGRSVDLELDTPAEALQWRRMLEVIVKKERGEGPTEGPTPSPSPTPVSTEAAGAGAGAGAGVMVSDEDWMDQLLLCSTIGVDVLPAAQRPGFALRLASGTSE